MKLILTPMEASDLAKTPDIAQRAKYTDPATLTRSYGLPEYVPLFGFGAAEIEIDETDGGTRRLEAGTVYCPHGTPMHGIHEREWTITVTPTFSGPADQFEGRASAWRVVVEYEKTLAFSYRLVRVIDAEAMAEAVIDGSDPVAECIQRCKSEIRTRHQQETGRS